MEFLKKGANRNQHGNDERKNGNKAKMKCKRKRDFWKVVWKFKSIKEREIGRWEQKTSNKERNELSYVINAGDRKK